MAQSKTIELSVPVEWHKETVTAIELKEPTGGDYLDYGDPRKIIYRPDGTVLWEENNGVIKSYIERCVVVSKGAAPPFVRLLNIADVKKIKVEMFGFFIDTSAAPETSD